MVTRESIVEAARGWLGTPYHHQASLKGVGADCLGLIRGIWRELEGPEPTLLAAACQHLVKLDDVGAARPADILVFRMRDEGVAKHAGSSCPLSLIPAKAGIQVASSASAAGGFVKGYRTQILGLITALSAVASWAVGDATLADLVTRAPVIFGGLGLAALGVKVDGAKVLKGTGNRAARQNDAKDLGVHASFMRGCIGSGPPVSGLSHAARA